MFLEGQIIEFLDADQLKPGYVRKQERDRLQVIDPRGRHLSVNGDRVVIVHCAAPEGEFPRVAKTILERVHARQSEVDIALLWESLGNSEREFQPLELAELFFSESTPEATSAVFHALSQDSLFFRRNGLRFVPKTADQVATEQTRRIRQRQREELREQMTDAVRRLVRSKTEITPDFEPVVDRIQSWMRNRTADSIEAIMEDVVGPMQARDAGYDILLRSGRISPDADRFLVTAGIEEHFSAVVTQAAAARTPVVHSPERLDFRDLPAITIDDEDTVEIDDAITVRQEDGQYVVGIHIADASAFVDRGDVLDIEALKRASTIYLPTVAVRMLPERVSTDLASLKKGVDRPVLTVEARFDSAFNRVGHRIVLGSIRVAERLTYEEVDDRIRAGDGALTILHGIALRLRDERATRGAITFRRPELKIRVHRGDAEEQIRITRLDPNSESRTLVSEMMVLLNGLAADFAATHNLPVIFRTQEARDALPPEASKLPDALAFDKLRRTFKRSRLSLTPGLHSGLGMSAYTQVSSPIRRYSDLVTQRQFTALLQRKHAPHTPEELMRVLAAAEAAEQEIRSLEERSTSYWLLQYLAREKMGAALNAIVLDNKGTVELNDYYLRGKLPDPGTAEPGAIVQVMIGDVDPLRAEIRFKRT
jgi:exoribonuclease II